MRPRLRPIEKAGRFHCHRRSNVDKLTSYLSGKKTYLVVIIALIIASLEWLTGDTELTEQINANADNIQLAILALLGYTIRDGIKTSTEE